MVLKTDVVFLIPPRPIHADLLQFNRGPVNLVEMLHRRLAVLKIGMMWACGLTAPIAGPALAAPPRVVAATPEVGDDGVDPTLAELRIEFDQDMDTGGSMSVCGGGPEFPKITGKARWESPRVILVPIALEPTHRYSFSVNCQAGRGFRSAAGEPAQVTPLSFSTAGGATEAQPSEPATPEGNRATLEALRRALTDRYSHRDVRRVNWDEEIAAHAAELEAIPTRGALARTITALLAPARDVHLSLMVGTARLATFSPMQAPNCNIATLQRVVPGWKDEGHGVFTGRFEDGLAYVFIGSWPSDAALIQPALEFIQKNKDAPGLIIDVRANGGGNEATARTIAACFVDERAVYSRNSYRDPDSPRGWTPELDRTIDPNTNGPRYGGPVAVLMGPLCMSSNESFLLMMRTCPRAMLIGEPSYGSSGNPKPVDLGGGLTLLLPSWRDTLPDGTPLEGRGILPDIGVRASAEELRSSDPVLEAARRAVRR